MCIRDSSIRGFSCVKGEPFEVEDGLAEQLLATGRFDEQPVIANPAEESDKMCIRDRFAIKQTGFSYP